jgi:hypothetical protein
VWQHSILRREFEPMADADSLARQTLDWLNNNPIEIWTPDLLFDRAWVRSKIVCIGERHDDAAHRDFVARKVADWGGPQNGLALEIDASCQEAISRYINGAGVLPSDQWFSRETHYLKILAAARQTQTEVVAMDQDPVRPASRIPSISPFMAPVDRNKHMADAILDLARLKSKVLILVGIEHAREASYQRERKRKKPPMGVQLVDALGDRVFTIYTMTYAGHGQETFFKVMENAFGTRNAIAFDVDRSPLGPGIITDLGQTIFWKDYCDGITLFFRN